MIRYDKHNSAWWSRWHYRWRVLSCDDYLVYKVIWCVKEKQQMLLLCTNNIKVVCFIISYQTCFILINERRRSSQVQKILRKQLGPLDCLFTSGDGWRLLLTLIGESKRQVCFQFISVYLPLLYRNHKHSWFEREIKYWCIVNIFCP